MDFSKKTRLLKRLLPRVAPAEMIERQGAGLESMGLPDAETEAAVAGFRKLSIDETLEAPQANALEAIIHKQFRPAVFVVNDTFDVPPAPWQALAETENRERIERAILSIGRIELPGMATIPFGGTGFVVGENLIMTNRHVAEIFARGLGQTELAFKPNRNSAINFGREVVPTPDVGNLSVQRVLMIHPYWDMALLQVDGLSPQQSALTLSTTPPEDLSERNVVVIGYPAQDPRNEIELQNRIFGGVYDVKRLQPGILRERREILSFENTVSAVTHDASTLGGNSGSAVVDVTTGEVLALHFAGLYLDANFAVPSYEMARDGRVVDAGVNFAAAVEPTNAWADRWRVADQPLETSNVPVASTQSPSPPPPPPQSVDVQGNSVTWTIPLSVTIKLGNPQVSSADGGGSRPTAPAAVEGLFGESESELVARAYGRFSTNALSSSGFSWAAALAGACASHLAYEVEPRVVEVCRQQWGFDTCDFIHLNDTECFVASTPNEVLLSFRGTAGIADWMRDLTVFSTEADYGSVHEGFYLGMKQVRAQIESVLGRVNVNDKKLVLTGHSLGGALATIAAAEFDGDHEVKGVYTFGQPAVGKVNFREFMRRYISRFFRIVNDDDIVAMVPPGYVHVGKLYRFGFFGSVSHEAVGASAPQEAERPMMSETEFRALQQQCAMGAQADATTPGVEGLLPGPSFLDHKMARYLKKTLKQLDQ